MKKRILYILAPNDRFNYGDLLFSYSILHCIGGSFDQVRHISTTRSDLSELGGIPTEPYEALYNPNPAHDNFLLVAGGESLFSKWGSVISFVDRRYYDLENILKKIFWFRVKTASSIYRRLVKVLLGIKTQYPFTIGHSELKGFRAIYYNAVGCSRLNSKIGARQLLKANNQKILRSVDLISVRDIDTHTALTNAKIENQLVADSAILISDIFTEDKIEGRLSINKSVTQQPYIYFQGNRHYLEQYAKEIASELQSLQQSTSLTICLCPIGTALGHEDQVGIDLLTPQLDELNVRYFVITSPNIYDIMHLIKCSQLYVGSSLHGIITAMSFGVPYVGYHKQKLGSYINTWGNNAQFASDISNINKTAQLALRNPIDSNLLHKQKESSIKYLNCIAKISAAADTEGKC